MPAIRNDRSPSDGATSSSLTSAFDTILSDRSLLLPPSHVTNYETYQAWIVSAGGDLSIGKKRHTAKRRKGHIPRPPNSFMLFRSWATLIAKSRIFDQSGFSKNAGNWWSELTDEERKAWTRLAQIVKDHHQEQYPDYKYSPSRTKIADPGQLISPNRTEKKLRPGPKKCKPAFRNPRRSLSTGPDSSYTSDSDAESPPLSPVLSNFSDESSLSDLRSVSSEVKVKLEPGIMEVLRHGSAMPEFKRSLIPPHKGIIPKKEHSETPSDWALGYPSPEDEKINVEEKGAAAQFLEPSFVPCYTSLSPVETQLRSMTGMVKLEDGLLVFDGQGSFGEMVASGSASSDAFANSMPPRSNGLIPQYAEGFDISMPYDDGLELEYPVNSPLGEDAALPNWVPTGFESLQFHDNMKPLDNPREPVRQYDKQLHEWVNDF